MPKANKSQAVKLAVIGASLAGLAATAYFFFGPKGKKHQKQDGTAIDWLGGITNANGCARR